MVGNAERVVVTGMGVISPLGCNLTEFWDGLLAGQSGVRCLEGGEFSEMVIHIGAVAWDFDVSRYLDRKEERRMSRSSQFGIAAAGQAIADAKLLDAGMVDW